MISAGEGGGGQTQEDRKSQHAVLLRYLCQVQALGSSEGGVW